jgi:membrane associated rhomboid family serine protease
MIPTRMATDLQPPLPWMDPGNFPEAPDSAPCGYRKKKKIIPCSPEELKEAIRSDKNKAIALVWIGTGGHMLVPVEVPWLLEDLIKRQRLFLGQHAAINILNTVVWGLLALQMMSGSKNLEWQIYFFNCLALGIIPLVQNRWSLHRLRSMTPETLAQFQSSARYGYWMSTRKSPWTYCLGVCIAIGQIATRHSSIAAAGIVKPAIHAGEWWRLLTGTLMHGSVLHFLFNILALIALGRITETTFHRAYVPVVFVLSALAGSLASLFLLPGVTSVGASGGIMGMIGFLLVLAWVHKRDFPSQLRRSLLMASIYTAIAGAFAYHLIDNAAHLGGFVAGGLFGLLVVRTHAVTIPDRNPRWWIPASVVSWGVIFATTALCLCKFF